MRFRRIYRNYIQLKTKLKVLIFHNKFEMIRLPAKKTWGGQIAIVWSRFVSTSKQGKKNWKLQSSFKTLTEVKKVKGDFNPLPLPLKLIILNILI